MLGNNPQAEEDYNHLFKIVLVGDAGVGKTHLLNRYIKGTLPKNNVPTIGVEFATRTVELANGSRVKAQIWDTAGQERYRAITSAHYRRAVGALLVYDVTKEKTFESVTRWMEELKYHAEPDIVIMLVGNKIDLVEKSQGLRKVSREDAKKVADEHQMLFEESSAITSQNVNDVFERLLQEIYETRSEAKVREGGEKLRSGNSGQSGGGKCC
mmetsp:Transcript_6109/g.5458  ORF Transcript_6109/g.5458 Transcript_6109/m.5458 type:complete len:212 (+) Transcript_6109:63-698(+)|eukprot:CAMPEP_0114589092 /NCGR_PEP_ID=MMETSP0125-20121206/11636_1 /TAXON_ID=485358 ORGANISM="Aristerostoma sp., Strain ATCC 50986" /NCGR_SAMPLE_ID=MMETSP0125 /ASSEMBLY_ACC=CAM_ASM_000245 /LENGTH=211 /DNA_ID=CAMNT_0001785825 /DNA_START=44 /DNA_END=679 /DNA_ORIENTATION=+